MADRRHRWRFALIAWCFRDCIVWLLACWTIAPRSPWQNGHTERLIGSIRRECLDHVVVFGEHHLRQLLGSYQRYYNDARTHLSLNKDAPV